MNQNKIKKAVFPVAGMGTRFLPATKANPKEMLPVVDKPLIQYAVEEAIDAGITELIFVTSMSKRPIEDHFDKNYELEAKLAERGKDEVLAMVRDIIPKGVSCVYVRQPEALGLGHAVLCASSVVNYEPFVVLLADELVERVSCNPLSEMIKLYNKHNASVLACLDVAKEEVSKYGILGVEGDFLSSAKVSTMIEKPSMSQAPSTLAAVGRYVLSPKVFDWLKDIKPGAGGEIQLTDALVKLIPEEGLYAYKLEEKRHDCGSKLGYLKATVEHGIKHPELGERFKNYLKKYVNTELS